MHDPQTQLPTTTTGRLAWNKGKLTGAKSPLGPKYIWSIRSKLQLEGRTRDLAMFNLAIDSKLRGCRCAEGRGHRTKWLFSRPCHNPSEENRTTGQVRTVGTD
jgi:hypothetical protein